MNFLQTLINICKSITKRDLIYGFIILLLIGALSFSVRKCTDTKAEYMNNIIALNDTIHYYEGKNGDLVATIRGFESDVKTLKVLNEELYRHIDDLKASGNVTNATYFTGVIDNPQRDTTYIVLHDTIQNGFRKDFAFNDEYRVLEGNVIYQEDTLGVNIDKDQVMFDYTVGMDDKNNIMIQSSNPYVKYSQISGFQVPKPHIKRWSLGPAINFGYDPIQNKPSFSVGVSLNYGLFQWGK